MSHDPLQNAENAAYLEALYLQFTDDPASVDPASRQAFEALGGAAPRGPTVVPRSLFAGGHAPPLPANHDSVDRQAKVARFINAYRVRGHEGAQTDPLGLEADRKHPELDPEYFGLTAADMDVVVSTSPMYGMPAHSSVATIIARLKQLYSGSVGVEFMNIRDVGQKNWAVEQFETRFQRSSLDRAAEVRVLGALTRADGFERFLAVKFQGNKRFSLEGAESIIPAMEFIIEQAGNDGVREVVIGMAHRGRLNVLLNILKKPAGKMLAEFAGQHDDHDSSGSGDVKYHLGYSSNIVTSGGHSVHLSLCFNPSHLEAVNPVCEGRCRAKQDRSSPEDRRVALPLLIHGDAAFAGQGVVAETLNLSDLPGYRTGGTIHLVINNQIGFTTTPTEGRSTPYSTDVARMLGVPIFHVNGEDPEAVAHVTELAVAWRQRYRRDVVIDLYCFRRHGHNEMDEPFYTQPLMYRRIAEHPGVREVYLRRLIQKGTITRADADAMEASFRADLDVALKVVRSGNGGSGDSALRGLWANYHSGQPDVADTRVPIARLRALLAGLNRTPDGFHLHPKLARSIYKLRDDQAAGNKPVDWAAAELLAYGSLVTAGHRVRLSGQDAGRGTFSHRHAVVRDQTTGASWCALDHLTPDQARFEVYNSLLSETAVLGFEYGYSMDYPDALVLWEAQFGDFANGGQIIIDNFIACGEAKWNRLSGLVMLLPHGYEGQGPEHSSARPERFLQMCAEGNLQVVNCTTPAQIFHLLRRQVLRNVRDPLVVFTPKSLLRTVASPLEELAEGAFEEVIADGAGRKRVVLCWGKVYYDLLAARGARQDVALVRVEQLYPFPLAAITDELARHPGAEVVWCQEEPKNMGPWPFVALQFMEAGILPRYAGRRPGAAPATGYHDRHLAEQASLVAEALG
ncbi:MAG: 2-oxoglutarate dehydrogenase E1 component [Myxococcales bacterium]|nr:2-oxoglutarate dehydrogenase E1 component [Myxococcales bacterium]